MTSTGFILRNWIRYTAAINIITISICVFWIKIIPSGQKAVTRIETPAEAAHLDFTKDIRLYSQTTKSLEEFWQIIEYIKEHISPDATFEYYDTICRQVANRMPNIRKFAAAHDLIFFVCGRKSSNGKILYQECKKINPNSYLIDQPEEIDRNLLEDVRSIGICGATSTPKWLMEEISKAIKSRI